MNKFYTDKKDIIDWLDKYEVKGYTLIPDEKYVFVVEVSGKVDLTGRGLNFIPIKFSNVSGNFDCGYNELISLEFCPEKVKGDFYCNNNQLESLEFCPEVVRGSFNCSNNQLTSLKYCPQTIGGSFYCSDNKLTSLEFCPEMVRDNFFCYDNTELKEIQNIIVFNLIYLEHKKAIAKKLANSLEDNLIDSKKLQNKIKL